MDAVQIAAVVIVAALLASAVGLLGVVLLEGLPKIERAMRGDALRERRMRRTVADEKAGPQHGTVRRGERP